MLKKKLNKTEFQQIFEVYFEPIKRFIYYKSGNEELASDITQEVFLKLWEKRQNIKPETLKSLLYTMAERIFIDKWRKEKVVFCFVKKNDSDFLEQNTPEMNYDYLETKAKYEKILAKMPEKARIVFLMSRIDGLKYKEIAERLAISIKTVEKRMNEALGQLKVLKN